MSNRSIARIQKELSDIKKCQETGDLQIKIDPKDDNFMKLTGQIIGPPDSPYEGATFILDIILPKDYPMAPPRIKFVTKIWHPNVCYEDGRICLDILKNRWAASFTLRTVLLSIQLLLSTAIANGALSYQIASQLRKSFELFNRTARHWANVYAGGPNREIEFEEMVEQLKSMGHDEVKARTYLSTNDWIVEKAVKAIKNDDEFDELQKSLN